MNDETLKIIAICKDVNIYNNSNINENIRNFFRDEYSIFNKDLLNEYVPRVLIKALYDYIDHCDSPSEVLRLLFLEEKDGKTLIEAIPTIFIQQKVCNIDRKTNNVTYINGFSQRYEKIRMELKQHKEM